MSEEQKHSSGCDPTCNGTYYFGGNYNSDGSVTTSEQPYSKPCWCGCHEEEEK